MTRPAGRLLRSLGVAVLAAWLIPQAHARRTHD
jgi:hypothetical protein